MGTDNNAIGDRIYGGDEIGATHRDSDSFSLTDRKAFDSWMVSHHTAVTGDVAGLDHITVPLRAGAPGPVGVPVTQSFAATPNRLLLALQQRVDETIAALPEQLPADLDVDALVAEIERVGTSVRKLGIHNVTYPAAWRTSEGWASEQRKTKLGLLDDEYALMGDLEDCLIEKMNLQTWETIQGGAEWAVMWGSFYGVIDGGKIWQTLDSVNLGVDVGLAGERLIAPKTELQPMTAMNELEAKMLLDTKDELSRLYEVTAGLTGYVQSQVAP